MLLVTFEDFKNEIDVYREWYIVNQYKLSEELRNSFEDIIFREYPGIISSFEIVDGEVE